MNDKRRSDRLDKLAKGVKANKEFQAQLTDQRHDAPLTTDGKDTAMNDNTTLTTTRPSDGFDSIDDGGGRSIIRGMKLSFNNDATWRIGHDAEPVDFQREFVVIEIAKVTQKWIDQLPVETRIIGPDEFFPDTEKMNAEAPPEEWREAFGREVGPWQNSYVVYLLDPASLLGFTFPTSTAGGFRAVEEMKGHVRRARMVQGDHVFPVVRLADTFMNTKFGGRQRPHFDVVRFVAIGGPTRGPLLEKEEAAPIDDSINY